MIIAHFSTRFADAFFPRLLEWQAAFVMFAGGIVMLTNNDLMVDSNVGYALMLRWGSQEMWGNFAAGLGLTRIVVLLVNGAWRRSPHARAIAAFLSCAVWFPLYVSFSAAAGWGVVFASGMLFGDLLNIIRTSRDARIVDDEYGRRKVNAGQ